MNSNNSSGKLRRQLDHKRRSISLELCKRSVHHFVNEFCYVYEPRNVEKGLPTRVPFKLRPKQSELIDWLLDREETQTHGLIEKSRDEGMSFIICAFVLHHWLFKEGFTAILGSNKRDSVDKLGDPKSLFYKVRYILYNLPTWMFPKGFDRNKHDNFTRMVNPIGDGAIVGEWGDELGRSGRASFVLLDEFAFMQNADSVNRAISQVSNVVIKGSTANGVGNAFYNERFGGKIPVFTMHWTKNPDKGQAWYDKQCAQLDPITVAQEIDIDYTASVPNIVIPNLWVRAAMKIRLSRGHILKGGLDVSADGKDYTVYSSRAGGVVLKNKKIVTPETHRSDDILNEMKMDGIDELFYDQQGVGSGINTTLKRAEIDGDIDIKITGNFNNQSCTDRIFEDQETVPVEERFTNWIAEQWWALRLRFERTYKRYKHNEWYPDDECIQIPDGDNELSAQLSQPTYKKASAGKIRVDKYGNGSSSPDKAESLLYSFAEIDQGREVDILDFSTRVTYGNDRRLNA